MEDKKKIVKFQYEKPELVDMMRAGAEGQNGDCENGTGDAYCYDGVVASSWCNIGSDHNG